MIPCFQKTMHSRYALGLVARSVAVSRRVIRLRGQGTTTKGVHMRRPVLAVATAGALAVGVAPAAAHPPLADSHFLPPLRVRGDGKRARDGAAYGAGPSAHRTPGFGRRPVPPQPSGSLTRLASAARIVLQGDPSSPVPVEGSHEHRRPFPVGKRDRRAIRRRSATSSNSPATDRPRGACFTSASATGKTSE